MASLSEETVQAVIRQVEFYFSDSNIPRDEFLRKKITESEDSMVSLALICSFKRMKEHLNLGNVTAEEIPEDTLKAVAETLRNKSTTLKLSEDGTKVGRISALLKPEELKEQLDGRTIAASPLEYDAKREAVESFFNQYAKVSSVRMPRHVADRRLFCGTALIEFTSEEDAVKVLKQKLVYAGVELELNPKKDFDEGRAKEEEEFEKSRPPMGSNHNNPTPEPRYEKGLIVAFTLKNMQAGASPDQKCTDEAGNDGANACKTGGELDTSENVAEKSELKVSESTNGDEGKTDEKSGLDGKELDDEDDKTSEVLVEKAQKGEEKENKSAVATYKDDKNVVMREDLKGVFKKFGSVKFIDFTMGANSGYIRFEEPEAAQKARAAAVLAKEGGLIVKNYIAILEPVTGEAESQYWKGVRVNQDKHRSEYKGNRGGRGGGRFNNRGGKHGRYNDNGAGGRRSKAQRV